jgi:ABC-type uncharacterized transport system permease subunit
VSENRVKVISLREHKRAAPAIRRAKAAGGLVGFFAAALFAVLHGVPFATAAERGLAVGIAGNVLAWGVSILLWRRILVAEAGAAAKRVRQLRAEAAEEQT